MFLLERGAFAGVNAAMMIRILAPFEDLYAALQRGRTLRRELRRPIRRTLARLPQLGINAADAMTVAQVAIGLLRQHLRPGDQVHGFVNHGGDAANIVPAHTDGLWMVRAPTIEDLSVTQAPGRALLREAGRVCDRMHAPHMADVSHRCTLTHGPRPGHGLDLYRANAVAARPHTR